MTAQPSSPIIAPAPTRAASADDRVADAWRDHHERLFLAVVRCTRDDEVAHDIVAETFEAMLREARAGRLPDNAAAWLHRVARNRVVDWSRRRARWAGHGMEAEGVGEDPASSVLAHERAAELHRALGCLSAAGRRAVLLEGQGYRPAEIAPLLGRTNQATRTLLCRAHRRVQAELAAAAAA